MGRGRSCIIGDLGAVGCCSEQRTRLVQHLWIGSFGKALLSGHVEGFLATCLEAIPILTDECECSAVYQDSPLFSRQT